MNFGLSPVVCQKLANLFKTFPEIKSVVIFGSRAIGTYREGSDIDIALCGPLITPNILRDILIKYYDLNLPYQLDLIHYDSITNPELKKHIDEFGKPLT